MVMKKNLIMILLKYEIIYFLKENFEEAKEYGFSASYSSDEAIIIEVIIPEERLL